MYQTGFVNLLLSPVLCRVLRSAVAFVVEGLSAPAKSPDPRIQRFLLAEQAIFVRIP